MNAVKGFYLPPGMLSMMGLLVGICVGLLLILKFARRWEARVKSGTGRMDEGRVIGVVGLMGAGKTSFIMKNWIAPAIAAGQTIVSNFSVNTKGFAGTSMLLRADTFGMDLLGIGSSLNVDPQTGEPMSGWFYDTACRCGKGHVDGCDKVMPAGTACCAGFRAMRECRCRQATVVIDESHAFVPASQSRPLPLELQIWFTMARKNHLQIIWSTQYFRWVHAAVRRLSQDVFVCEQNGMDGKHIAHMMRLQASGDLGKETVLSIKYDNKSVRSMYDTYEVILPSHTAEEMAGTVGKRTIGSSGRLSGPRPVHLAEVRSITS